MLALSEYLFSSIETMLLPSPKDNERRLGIIQYSSTKCEFLPSTINTSNKQWAACIPWLFKYIYVVNILSLDENHSVVTTICTEDPTPIGNDSQLIIEEQETEKEEQIPRPPSTSNTQGSDPDEISVSDSDIEPIDSSRLLELNVCLSLFFLCLESYSHSSIYLIVMYSISFNLVFNPLFSLQNNKH